MHIHGTSAGLVASSERGDRTIELSYPEKAAVIYASDVPTGYLDDGEGVISAGVREVIGRVGLVEIARRGGWLRQADQAEYRGVRHCLTAPEIWWSDAARLDWARSTALSVRVTVTPAAVAVQLSDLGRSAAASRAQTAAASRQVLSAGGAR